MNERMKRIAFGFGFWLLWVLPLDAVIMVPLSIEDLTAKAQLVAHGTVVSKSCQRDSAGRIYTKIDLRVAEVWKGAMMTNHLILVHGGGILGEERVEVSGQVDYQIGEEVVAFIVLNQRGEGVTLGLSQGKFHVWKDRASGALFARNPFHGGTDVAPASGLPLNRIPQPTLPQTKCPKPPELARAEVSPAFKQRSGGEAHAAQTEARASTASRPLTLTELKAKVIGENK